MNLAELKEISDFPGYWASKEGKIYRVYEIKQNLNRSRRGYFKVCLYKNSKRFSKYVHRLVYEAFKGKIKLKDHINHKDWNRTNNHIDNLESLNAKLNNIHRDRKIEDPF
jgi:hypothetical protein